MWKIKFSNCGQGQIARLEEEKSELEGSISKLSEKINELEDNKAAITEEKGILEGRLESITESEKKNEEELKRLRMKDEELLKLEEDFMKLQKLEEGRQEVSFELAEAQSAKTAIEEENCKLKVIIYTKLICPIFATFLD